MKRLPTIILTTISGLLLMGCASFRVQQVDDSPGGRKISSDIRASAWFSSAQTLAKMKALQTDKTQSFGANSFDQQGATNAVEALNAIARILEAIKPTQ